MSRTFLWSWLGSVPALIVMAYRAPFITPRDSALFVGAFAWFFIGLAIFLIKAHRTKLHRRLPWPLIAPYLALKWAIIAWGGVGLVAIFIDHAGSVFGGLWLLAAPALFGIWLGLSRRQPSPAKTSTPEPH